MNSETRQCQNCKKEFTIEPEDFTFYEKIKVPPPTWCPECRLIRRLSLINRRTLYKTECKLCGKSIITMYSPDKQLKTFCNVCWWSDRWDPIKEAQEYDFSKPFFEQFKQLMSNIAWAALGNDQPTMINSDYCNLAGYLKNCYLVFHADFTEDTAYADQISNSKNCFDVLMTNNSSLCYESTNIKKCFRTYFSVDCSDSYDIFFSKNLIGCSNCFGCIGLRIKQYYIFNKQYSKEEYFEKIKSFNLGSYKNLLVIKDKSENFLYTFPLKYIHGRHNTNVIGDYIENSKNVINSFQVENTENCKNCAMTYLGLTKDSCDYTSWGNNASLVYECSNSGENISKIKFGYQCWPNCIDLEYAMYCISSSHLFGCIGLRHKQYCILNKQYTKSEYEKLVPKIIQHMNEMPYVDKKGRIYKYGEFFPPELSPFCYNETIAQEYFPLTKEETIEQGYLWKDPEERNYQITIKAENLPDHIKDVPDSITNEIIGCQHQGKCNEQCTKAFKIIKEELQFYRRMNLPLPRLCPNCRHYQRLKQRNPLKLWHRKCQCAGTHSENRVYKNTIKHFHGNKLCPNEFETTYSPDRPEIVYCEECYLKEVV